MSGTICLTAEASLTLDIKLCLLANRLRDEFQSPPRWLVSLYRDFEPVLLQHAHVFERDEFVCGCQLQHARPIRINVPRPFIESEDMRAKVVTHENNL